MQGSHVLAFHPIREVVIGNRGRFHRRVALHLSVVGRQVNLPAAWVHALAAERASAGSVLDAIVLPLLMFT